MKTLKERIAVETAFDDGEAILVRSLEESEYYGFNTTRHKDKVTFQWTHYDYKVKPEPLEFWVNIYDGRRGNQTFDTKEDAKKMYSPRDGVRTVKVSEVLK